MKIIEEKDIIIKEIVYSYADKNEALAHYRTLKKEGWSTVGTPISFTTPESSEYWQAYQKNISEDD